MIVLMKKIHYKTIFGEKNNYLYFHIPEYMLFVFVFFFQNTNGSFLIYNS